MKNLFHKKIVQSFHNKNFCNGKKNKDFYPALCFKLRFLKEILTYKKTRNF